MGLRAIVITAEARLIREVHKRRAFSAIIIWEASLGDEKIVAPDRNFPTTFELVLVLIVHADIESEVVLVRDFGSAALYLNGAASLVFPCNNCCEA